MTSSRSFMQIQPVPSTDALHSYAHTAQPVQAHMLVTFVLGENLFTK